MMSNPWNKTFATLRLALVLKEEISMRVWASDSLSKNIPTSVDEEVRVQLEEEGTEDRVFIVRSSKG